MIGHAVVVVGRNLDHLKIIGIVGAVIICVAAPRGHAFYLLAYRIDAMLVKVSDHL